MSEAAGVTLGEALAPLQSGYVRRLGEMAARVQGPGLLREPTTRDEAGYLVVGPDGLPLRFDVADAASGETFEVGSAQFDAPAAASVRVGAIEFELLPGSWEALPVACRFDGEPVPEDAAALAELLRAFLLVGWHGGFSPRGEAAPWAGRPHAGRVVLEGEVVTAVYDLGSCPAAALEVLARALDGFSRDRAPIAKVTIGGTPPRDLAGG